MFLGSRVDDAITLYYQRILERGERLSVDQVKDAFWDDWKAAAEREQLGIAWEEDMPEDRAFKLGLDAIDLSFRELVPRLGEPVAAQRKLEYVARPPSRVERPVLSRPRDACEPMHGEQVARGRRLQGQVDAADRVQGRRRLPAGRVPRRSLARGRPGFQAK